MLRAHHRWARTLKLVSAMAVIACGPDPGADSTPARSARELTEAVWDVEVRIEASAADTVLLLPGLITHDGNTILVFDRGDARLKAFDRSGRWIWSFGALGDGPGEFRNPTDVDIDADGTIRILDQGAGRITVLRSDGMLLQVVNLSAAAWRFLLSGERMLLFRGGAGDVFFETLPLTGGPGEAHGYPSNDLIDAEAALRFVEVGAGNDERWVAGFSSGDLFLLFQRDDILCRGTLVDARPIGRKWKPDDNYYNSMLAIIPRGRFVEVLSHMEHDSTTIVIDRFRTDDCSYQSSSMVSFPGAVFRVSGSDDGYYVLSRDPRPSVFFARSARQ